jgi:hypothetical protein
MGTDKVVFEGVLWGGATGSHVTGSDRSDISHMTGSDVSHVSGSMFCAYATGSCACATGKGAYATGSCAISALVWPFDRKWRQSRDRKRPCPEGGLTGSRFCACPAFFPAFFLVVVTWLPDVTDGHLTPSGFSWMYACATVSCATPAVTEGHVTPSEVSLGCSIGRPRPITIGNPASYI